jgi:hypothetical protein
LLELVECIILSELELHFAGGECLVNSVDGIDSVLELLLVGLVKEPTVKG